MYRVDYISPRYNPYKDKKREELNAKTLRRKEEEFNHREHGAHREKKEKKR
jgi:hypothetical protein